MKTILDVRLSSVLIVILIAGATVGAVLEIKYWDDLLLLAVLIAALR